MALSAAIRRFVGWTAIVSAGVFYLMLKNVAWAVSVAVCVTDRDRGWGLGSGVRRR